MVTSTLGSSEVSSISWLQLEQLLQPPQLCSPCAVFIWVCDLQHLARQALLLKELGLWPRAGRADQARERGVYSLKVDLKVRPVKFW